MTNKTIIYIFAIFLTITLSSCGRNNTDINEYETYIDVVSDSKIFMPDLNNLGDYQTLDVYQFSRVHKTINLVVTYDEVAYLDAKEAINQNYIFLIDPIYWNEIPQIPEVEVSYNGFEIKIVENSDFDYPNHFGMIGYNDDTYQICYMFFSDDSRNQISSMERLIEDSFKFSN